MQILRKTNLQMATVNQKITFITDFSGASKLVLDNTRYVCQCSAE